MIFKIGEIHPNTPHLFADLAELLLLFDYEGRNKLHKNDLEAMLSRGPVSHEEIDDEEAACEEFESGAELNGRQERQLDDVLIQLEYRSKALKDFYPFTFEGDELVRIDSVLSEKQRVYRFLLVCSRLRSFGRNGIPQKWARFFANLSKVAMAGLVPSHASVRIFDANSDDRKTYYSTDLRKALKKLGADLRVLKVNEDECDKSPSSGDAGLDLVAIVDFDDGAANAFALFGQCGAQETGWPKKTLEAHSIRFRHCFQIQFDHPSVMFIPLCYRTADGEWCDNQSANGILLIDRERILSLLDIQKSWSHVTSSTWFSTFESDINNRYAFE